jgi:hypothetical protein
MLKESIDNYLCKINEDYATERSAFLELDLKVVCLDKFYGWLRSQGKSFGQSKVPRVLKSTQHDAWLTFLNKT